MWEKRERDQGFPFVCAHLAQSVATLSTDLLKLFPPLLLLRSWRFVLDDCARGETFFFDLPKIKLCCKKDSTG